MKKTEEQLEIKAANSCCSEQQSSGEILKALADPHAEEKDWLLACDELKQKSIIAPRRTKKTFVSAAIIAVLLMGLAASGVVASYFHLGPFAQRQEQEIDFGPYMEALEKQIKSKWKPPTDREAIVKLHFKVHPNGDVSDVGFERMSRISATDAAAIKAIVEAMPALPPLPTGINDAVDISFTFDVNHKDVTHKGRKN